MKTQFKTNIVERYKNGESSYQISKNEGCSYNAVLRELKRRGVNTGLRFWTQKEIEKLKEIYPITSNEKLLKEFPNRKESCILAVASKLGLKKIKCKKICKNCGREFITMRGKEICLKCVKIQWERKNLKNHKERQIKWLQKNPEYLKEYIRRPEVKKRMCEYLRQLSKENPKFRLDMSMSVAIRQSLKGRKAGRSWEKLVGYTLKDLIGHLEEQFNDKMNWENYGSYWELDHIKPRSLFKYTSPEDPEFEECWALKNLQPLEKFTNRRKSNTFALESSSIR